MNPRLGFLRALTLTAIALGTATVALAAPVHIVVLGSSTAAGTGPTSPDSAWVNRYRAALQALDPGHQVTNLAVGGYTTYQIQPTGFVPPAGRPRPDTLHNVSRALSLGPDAIVINLPSNDATAGYTIAEQLSNYDRVLAAAGAAGVPVWISTTQPRNLTQAGRDNLMAMRDSTFARWGDHAIDFWTEIANPDGTINPIYGSGDGIHLNNAAHRILFERVMAKNIPQAVTVGVGDPAPRPQGFRLLPGRPNPTSGTATFHYRVDRPMAVLLSIYDVRGARVATLVDGWIGAGEHSAHYATRGLGSGTYFCELRTQEGTAVRSVTIVH